MASLNGKSKGELARERVHCEVALEYRLDNRDIRRFKDRE